MQLKMNILLMIISEYRGIYDDSSDSFENEWLVFSFCKNSRKYIFVTSAMDFVSETIRNTPLQMVARCNFQMLDLTPRWLLDRDLSKQTGLVYKPTFQMQLHDCWRLESAIVVARKGSKQTDQGASPREPKFHRIPNWSRLDHRRPSRSSTLGGSGTKKGDRGYIRLIPRQPPTAPSHHTQKISIVPLRITYADDPCIVLYLLPPKSPLNPREAWPFSEILWQQKATPILQALN